MSAKNNITYDAAIIGVGQAGNPLIKKLVSEKWNIAVIEKDFEGGSCINYGCTPTKAMISSAKTAYMAQNADQWGINTRGVEADFKKVIQRRNNIVEMFRKSTTDFLEGNENITFFRGTASFNDKKSLAVTDNNGKQQYIQANKIFINTGTVPRIPDIPGLVNVDFHTSKNWMEIESLPKKLAIVGGGYIGLEFAQMFHRLGSEVTLFQNGTQLMPREDEDIAAEVKTILEDEGVGIHLEANILNVKKESNNIKITYQTPDGRHESSASTLLIAAGTSAAIHDLHLEHAGINTDKKGYIIVNEKLQTSTQNVFALGDVKGGPEFTHISYDDYRILENYLFGDNTRFITDRPIPYALFTDPQLGRIGFNEKMAKKSNIEFRLAKINANDIARSIETGHEKGLLKVLIADNDTIVGASLLMDEGGELMAALQIAIMGKIKYQQLRDGVFAHPTYAEGFNTLFSGIQ
jgi:pyruvate/2-oxoglutarate dehydrogenase complex dihydrolipoamide dehydrogenase (E3) component